MVTTNKHINITLPASIYTILQKLSARDDIAVSTKALELIELALELEKDELLSSIVVSRDTKNSTFVSHKKTWV